MNYQHILHNLKMEIQCNQDSIHAIDYIITICEKDGNEELLELFIESKLNPYTFYVLLNMRAYPEKHEKIIKHIKESLKV